MDMKQWTETARRLLVGRTIKDAAYNVATEAAMGWSRTGLELLLDDGSTLLVSRDDEGNGPGALFHSKTDGKGTTLPVM